MRQLYIPIDVRTLTPIIRSRSCTAKLPDSEEICAPLDSDAISSTLEACKTSSSAESGHGIYIANRISRSATAWSEAAWQYWNHCFKLQGIMSRSFLYARHDCYSIKVYLQCYLLRVTVPTQNSQNGNTITARHRNCSKALVYIQMSLPDSRTFSTVNTKRWYWSRVEIQRMGRRRQKTIWAVVF